MLLTLKGDISNIITTLFVSVIFCANAILAVMLVAAPVNIHSRLVTLCY